MLWSHCGFASLHFSFVYPPTHTHIYILSLSIYLSIYLSISFLVHPDQSTLLLRCLFNQLKQSASDSRSEVRNSAVKVLLYFIYLFLFFLFFYFFVGVQILFALQSQHTHRSWIQTNGKILSTSLFIISELIMYLCIVKAWLCKGVCDWISRRGVGSRTRMKIVLLRLIQTFYSLEFHLICQFIFRIFHLQYEKCYVLNCLQIK